MAGSPSTTSAPNSGVTFDPEIRDDRDRRYASHVPVVRAFLGTKPWSIMEFGCGRFSTPFLATLAERFVSWEYSDQWLSVVSQALPMVDIRLTPRSRIEFAGLFASLVTPEHALFIDGSPNQWRAEAIVAAFPKLPKIIFAHDWPGGSYGYDAIAVPPAYRLLVYCGFQHTRTAVLLRRDAAPQELPQVPDHKLESDT